MSSETVGELRIDVTVQLAKMQAQFDDMQRRVRVQNARLNSEFRSMARGIQGVMGAIGVSLAPVALIAFGKSVIQLGGHIVDLSNTAGVNAQAFQALALHFQDSGVSMEELSTAFVKLRKNTQEAVSGNKEMAASFRTLGIDPAKLQAKAMEQQLELLAISIASAVDQNAAFNAALDILGVKAAPKLMASLKQLGVEGLDKIGAKFKDISLTPEQLASLDAAGDKLERMWMYVKLLGAKAVVKAFDAAESYTGGPYLGFWLAYGMAQKMGMTQRNNGKTGSMPIRSFKWGSEGDLGKLTKEQLDKLKGVAPGPEYKSQGQFGLLAGALTEYEDQIGKSVDSISHDYQDLTQAAENARKGVHVNLVEMAKDAATMTKDPVQLEANVYNKLTDFFGKMDDASQKAYEQATKTKEAAMDMGWAFSSAFENAILSGEKLSDVMKGLAQDILRIAIRTAITQPIGSAIGSFISGIFGGGKAVGGPVNAGTAYMVGEMGKELFVPETDGTIIPNGALPTGGGGPRMVVNIDARNADRAGIEQLRADVRRMNAEFNERAVSAVGDWQRRSSTRR